ncbi:hypothetical protein BDV96DRAFT_603360 [Lophiotrema nucula]|uniref:Uncharacterized protein n=1 Tax=Lophiotrema nucula TaxID=690887 RepID=A0A6A5YVK8_9PLEO|nr:hypothetical protein BDV96DRAFT_603360 [Lophiotrema nucula]
MVFTDLHHPYVGAHIGLYEPSPDNGVSWGAETKPPARYDQIRFDAVDVLHVGSFITTKEGHLSIGGSEDQPGGKKFNYAHRFEYIVKKARKMNPNIRIIAEQMFSGNEAYDNLGKDPHKITTMVDIFTNSVRDFLLAWQAKPDVVFEGKLVSLRIDGYDVDYEGEVVKPFTHDLLTKLHEKLNTDQKRPFSVGITPYKTDEDQFLNSSMAKSCDFVNMQRYDGGKYTMPKDYLEQGAIEGLDPAKLVYGIQIETPSLNAVANDTIEKIAEAPWTKIEGKRVAGIWTWRLGSTPWESENLIQVWLYNLVHGKKADGTSDLSFVPLMHQGKVPDLNTVKQDWQKRGGAV